MKKIISIIWILFLCTIPTFVSAANCDYTGNPLENFKNCSPKNVIQEWSEPQLNVTNSGSGFMLLVQKIVNRIQTITFFIAVGIIVWIGLLMVLPANAEAKEATKWKLISVLLGFLAMLSATIIVNILVNLLYDVFN